MNIYATYFRNIETGIQQRKSIFWPRPCIFFFSEKNITEIKNAVPTFLSSLYSIINAMVLNSKFVVHTDNKSSVLR